MGHRLLGWTSVSTLGQYDPTIIQPHASVIITQRLHLEIHWHRCTPTACGKYANYCASDPSLFDSKRLRVSKGLKGHMLDPHHPMAIALQRCHALGPVNRTTRAPARVTFRRFVRRFFSARSRWSNPWPKVGACSPGQGPPVGVRMKNQVVPCSVHKARSP